MIYLRAGCLETLVILLNRGNPIYLTIYASLAMKSNK